MKKKLTHKEIHDLISGWPQARAAAYERFLKEVGLTQEELDEFFEAHEDIRRTINDVHLYFIYVYLSVLMAFTSIVFLTGWLRQAEILVCGMIGGFYGYQAYGLYRYYKKRKKELETE